MRTTAEARHCAATLTQTHFRKEALFHAAFVPTVKRKLAARLTVAAPRLIVSVCRPFDRQVAVFRWLVERVLALLDPVPAVHGLSGGHHERVGPTAAPHPNWIGDFPDGPARRPVVAWTHLSFPRRAG